MMTVHGKRWICPNILKMPAYKWMVSFGFRRDFNFSTNASTYVSLGPIDDSDIVYINGIQIGLTENEYAKNRYYDVPLGALKKGKNTIAIRVEDTGGGGGVYGEAKQMYIRSGDTTVSLAGDLEI